MVVAEASGDITGSDPAWWDLIWKDRVNRGYLWAALLLSTIGWVIFKLVYPLPFVTHDGYYYIEAALLHPTISVWPIGYSWFLRMARHLPHPAYAIVTLQWMMIIIANLFLFFSWLFLLRPSRGVARVVFVLLFANPLICYFSNYILSDCLFATLSILWFTQLLWVIRKPGSFTVFTSGLLLALAFTVRYNALYYPLINILAFVLQRRNKWLMAAGIVFPMVLIGAFIIFTGGQVKNITGKWQYSAYSGWKLANNALYMYSHVNPDMTDNLPPSLNSLDSLVRTFIKKNPPQSLFEDDATAGSYFMFGRNSPLIDYMERQYGNGEFMNSRKWFVVAPLYQSYGYTLIRKYPGHFFIYFVGPNLYRYFFPPAEILGGSNEYAIYESSDAPLINIFFGFPKPADGRSVMNTRDYLLYPSSVLFTLSHYFFIFCVMRCLMLGGFRKLPRPKLRCVYLAMGLWLCDLGFSILTSAVVLRYQVFIVTLEISFAVFLWQYASQDPKRATADVQL